MRACGMLLSLFVAACQPAVITAPGGGSGGAGGAAGSGGAGGSGGSGGGNTPLPLTTPISPVTNDAVYVINGSGNSISVVDATTNSVVGTIAIANAMYPHHVYLSADRTKMLVAIPGMDLSMGHDGAMSNQKGAVLLLEAATGRTLAATWLDMMNHNAIYSPDGTEVWTSQMMMPGMIAVLDAQTLAVKQMVNVGDMPAEITFAPGGTHAFVANGMTDSVSVIDPSTKMVLQTIPTGMDPVGAWPGSDGIMYTDCEKGKVLTAINHTTMSVVSTINLGFTPGMAATPPGISGQVWVTDSDNGKLVFFATAGGTKVGEVVTGAGAHGIAFSADGTKAYVTNQFANTLSVIDMATKTVRATVNVGQKPNGLVFRARL